MHTLLDSPTEDHNEVHDVPPIPEVRAFMKHKAQGDDFYACLKTEHPYEVGLCLLLWVQSKREIISSHWADKELLQMKVSCVFKQSYILILRDYELWLCLWIMCSSPVFWTWVFCPLREGAAPKPTRYSWRWWWRGSCTQMEWKAKVKEQLAQIMSTVCFSLCSIKLWDEIAYVVPSWCSKNRKMD